MEVSSWSTGPGPLGGIVCFSTSRPVDGLDIATAQDVTRTGLPPAGGFGTWIVGEAWRNTFITCIVTCIVIWHILLMKTKSSCRHYMFYCIGLLNVVKAI